MWGGVLGTCLDLLIEQIVETLVSTIKIHLQTQPGPIPLQPVFALQIIRHHFVDFIPECVGMVTLVYMAKFMNDYIIDNFYRCHHTFPMERQCI
jgi:hypothetical protein